MSYVIYHLGEPHTCNGPCQHHDCAELRRLVSETCPYCDGLIGQRIPVTRDDAARQCHVGCYMQFLDREHAQEGPELDEANCVGVAAVGVNLW